MYGYRVEYIDHETGETDFGASGASFKTVSEAMAHVQWVYAEDEILRIHIAMNDELCEREYGS